MFFRLKKCQVIKRSDNRLYLESGLFYFLYDSQGGVYQL